MKVYRLTLKPPNTPKDITASNLTVFTKATSVGDAFTKVTTFYKTAYTIISVEEAIDTNIV